MGEYKPLLKRELTEYVEAFFGRVERVSLISRNPDTGIYVIKLDERNSNDGRSYKGNLLLKCFIPPVNASQGKIGYFSELFSKEINISTLVGSFYPDHFPKVYDSDPREVHAEKTPALVSKGIFPEKLQFMLVEYINGATLRKLIDKNHMLFTRKVEIALHIAKGINYLHSYEGMTHKDIKPENIVVDLEGKPKIIDLGIADFLGGLLCENDIITTCYCSPEQVEQVISKKIIHKNDPSTDVYSFGLLLYELMTGRHVHEEKFDGMDETDILLKIMRKPLKGFKSTGNAEIDGIVYNSTRQKKERYPDMSYVVRDLEAVMSNTLPC